MWAEALVLYLTFGLGAFGGGVVGAWWSGDLVGAQPWKVIVVLLVLALVWPAALVYSYARWP